MNVSISRDAAVLALVALVFQNTFLVILLKFTFRKGAEPYTPASVVLVTELVKLVLCSLVAACQSKHNLFLAFSTAPGQILLFVPSCLYVIQNNLLFFGAKLLPTIVYVVCSQTKILTTALLSRVILATRFSNIQCMSLFFLAVGISFVQQKKDKGTIGSWDGNLATGTLGVAAVLLASLTSGTAGIVLEKIYKGNSRPDYTTKLEKTAMEHTIWARNVQLSLISLPFALLGALLQNKDLFITYNFTKGFDAYVWGVVFLQAAGGVIIAFVMKFANNIMKCLAVSISICCCAVYSVATGDVDNSASLVFGICLVITSVYKFSTKPEVVAHETRFLPK